MTAAVPTSAAPVRERRTWDLVLTIILLVAYLVITIIASSVSFFLAFAGDSCGASSTCNYDQIGTGILVILVGVWVPTLFVLVISIVLLVKRRLAFWVPLIGIALTIIVTVIGIVIVTDAIRPS